MELLWGSRGPAGPFVFMRAVSLIFAQLPKPCSSSSPWAILPPSGSHCAAVDHLQRRRYQSTFLIMMLARFNLYLQSYIFRRIPVFAEMVEQPPLGFEVALLRGCSFRCHAEAHDGARSETDF